MHLSASTIILSVPAIVLCTLCTILVPSFTTVHHVKKGKIIHLLFSLK
jgi:hypothetical protein